MSPRVAGKCALRKRLLPSFGWVCTVGCSGWSLQTSQRAQLPVALLSTREHMDRTNSCFSLSSICKDELLAVVGSQRDAEIWGCTSCPSSKIRCSAFLCSDRTVITDQKLEDTLNPAVLDNIQEILARNLYRIRRTVELSPQSIF